MTQRTDALVAAEQAIAEGLDEYLDAADSCRVHPAFAGRVHDLFPKFSPLVRSATLSLQFFGVPVLKDLSVPRDAINVYDRGGKLLASVTVQF